MENILSMGSFKRKVNIGFCNCLAIHWRQAIIRTNYLSLFLKFAEWLPEVYMLWRQDGALVPIWCKYVYKSTEAVSDILDVFLTML